MCTFWTDHRNGKEWVEKPVWLCQLLNGVTMPKIIHFSRIYIYDQIKNFLKTFENGYLVLQYFDRKWIFSLTLLQQKIPSWHI